ncbi:MAG: hypothetical protein PHQ86_09395 [Dehalococcoidales bacterium]|nr:hypothetical protein [Dehalococcoidales bacterium]
MGKYILIPIILLLLIIPLASCATVSNLIPKAIASDTQKIVKQVEADTDDVFVEIQKNIDLVANLKYKVEQARINNQTISLDETIKDLQTVTYSYEKLSGQQDAIRKGLLKKIASIEDMQSRVDTEIDTLKQKRADYTTQLRQVSDPNPEIVRTRQEALAQAIRYLDMQIQLWTEFNNIEAGIIAEMGNVQKATDSFLNVIDSSAILFREGLNLLVLQRDINEALSLFTRDLPRMEQLTNDMEKSWANLDYLIENLTTLSLKP